jgi:hypothetical protein
MPARRGCPDFKEEAARMKTVSGFQGTALRCHAQEEDQRHRGKEEDLCSGLDFRIGLSKILDMNWLNDQLNEQNLTSDHYAGSR